MHLLQMGSTLGEHDSVTPKLLSVEASLCEDCRDNYVINNLHNYQWFYVVLPIHGIFLCSSPFPLYCLFSVTSGIPMLNQTRL